MALPQKLIQYPNRLLPALSEEGAVAEVAVHAPVPVRVVPVLVQVADASYRIRIVRKARWIKN